MRINWKIRFKNPTFYAQIVLAVLTPVLAYLGLEFSDITTWAKLGTMVKEAYSNPFLLGLVLISLFNANNDPTVDGLGDSKQALRYEEPKDKRNEIY